jgi:hypothetical protein
MTQALPKPITYKEFIEWYPNDGKRYELHNGSPFSAIPKDVISQSQNVAMILNSHSKEVINQ